MKTGSLRLRVTVATLIVLAIVLAGVVASTTLLYRSSLQRDVRGQLENAALAFEKARPGQQQKQLIASLALEGIATDVQTGQSSLPPAKAAASGTPPIKPGASVTSSGSLFVLTDVRPDGARVTFSSSDARIAHSVKRLLVVELLVALVALALAALVLRRVTTATLRPLTEIERTATGIAAGDTSRLAPTRSDTELGRLAVAFDRMVDSLEAAASRAQRSEAAMRRFLADASHELRAPAAVLQASAETLLREQPERPERDRIEARLAQEAAHLGRLLDDLLSLARVEAHAPGTGEVIDLAALARTSLREALPENGDVDVTTELADGTCVRGDSGALTRAIRNLLDNAISAAGRAGHVLIDVHPANGHGLVCVVDDGPGVPSPERARIFDRFVRLEHAHAPGTGLGLAIAREIARQHGGDISCDPVERGASFTLRLPLQLPREGVVQPDY
jgi:signal transduction histidine kinase